MDASGESESTAEDRAAFAVLREHALAKPGAVEEYPWGHVVWKVRGKLFAIASEGGCGVTLKSTLEKQAMLVQHPKISIASHVGRFGWVYVEASDEDTLALALDLMEESYQAVLPRRKRPQPTRGIAKRKPG